MNKARKLKSTDREAVSPQFVALLQPAEGLLSIVALLLLLLGLVLGLVLPVVGGGGVSVSFLGVGGGRSGVLVVGPFLAGAFL